LASERCQTNRRAMTRFAVLAILAHVAPCVTIAGEPRSGLVVTAHSSLQAFRVEDPPRGESSPIRLSAARGETESFQLALENRSPGVVRDIRIVVSGLTGVDARVFATSAVNVAKPGRSSGAPVGHYFDLLRPIGGEVIASGEYRPYWIDLRAASDATPGVRDGQVTVSTSAGSGVLPIRFQVRDFELPVAPTLKLAFAFTQRWMEAYYGRTLTREQIRAAQDMMLEHHLGPVPMWGSGAELFGDESRLKECLAGGMNVILVTCGGRTDEEIDRSLAALETKIALLKRSGALGRTYFFGYDEVTVNNPALIPAMRKAYQRFHERHPEIPRINTSQPDPRIKDVVDIFVVPTSLFILPMAQGKEVWWYSVGADNLASEPDFRIDFPPVAHRGFFMADWKAGVKGHLYWAVQREWPDNKEIRDKSRPENEWRPGYHNSISKVWTQANGGGNLFYPDEAGGMLATPRVKRIRDGIEDYEYLAQLRAMAQRKAGGDEKLLGIARELLNVPDDLVRLSAGWREGWHVAEMGEAACSATVHPAAIHGGKQALRMLPTPEGVHVWQEVPAIAGKTGVFSGWIKTDDLAGQARLFAEYRDAGGRVLKSLQSRPATGSQKGFVRRQVTLTEAPRSARTLRVGLSAEVESTSEDQGSPLRKAFFDDLSLQMGEDEVPLVNSGFETERLHLNLDPAALLAYRERVAECLEQCIRVAGTGGPKR